ncbi:multidrug ABC transporter ATP-binding protein [Stutzerimonas nosocomialis]|uniref:Multidrug ABC transporter ATP-binding protein n=1 Tax=Stutzerimonas nosocomialis TaxID=1056496 RepID=A0A5R9QDC2_9GAMM|nr:ABC transporter ATP-binding protein [Stutzerimonas nosocomialis]TLX62802.1 multidrug ABC transporter ATP-binding protein [Stutzerimonas nosocomialis]
MLFRRFENLIDPFKEAPATLPPHGIFRFYLHYLMQVWPLLVALLTVGFFVTLIEVALFSFIGQLIDMVQATPSAEFFEQNANQLIWMAVVALLLRPLFFGLHDLLVHQSLSPSLTNLIRWQNHRYVLRQSLGFFHNDFSGRIAQRVMQTGPALRESAVQVVDSLWHVIIYAGSALVLFAQADIRLVIPLTLWIVGYIAALCYFVPRVRRRSADASEGRSRVMGRVVDGYTNILTLKLFAHSQHEERYAHSAMQDLVQRFRWQSRIITAMDFSIICMNGLLIAGTVGLALWLWSIGEITPGAIALAAGLVIRINNMSEWVMWVVNSIFENVGTVQDGMRTIVQPQQLADRPDAAPLQVREGGIRFDNIHFHYGKAEGVIAGLDLQIRPGEKIGLVGPSGAGKSTLINLLLRLYDLESGRILIDDQDIARVTQESLRAQIGVVTQDTALLHRSIRDNLRYGKPDASDEDLLEAIRGARADSFIPELSDDAGRTGLDAYVGERGVKLSGGQRQRIAIARVLLKNAPILVLDEATSALDSEVEAAIQDSLETLMEGKTVIAIAHRLSTIARMDRLVVIDRGRIVETGTHAELLERNGLYARLWQHQTGGFVGVE